MRHMFLECAASVKMWCLNCYSSLYCWFGRIKQPRGEKGMAFVFSPMDASEFHQREADSSLSHPPVTWAGVELVTGAPRAVRQGKSVGSGGIAEDAQCHGQQGVSRLANGEDKETRKNLDCFSFSELNCSGSDQIFPSRRQCISVDHAVIIACMVEKSCTILSTALWQWSDELLTKRYKHEDIASCRALSVVFLVNNHCSGTCFEF